MGPGTGSGFVCLGCFEQLGQSTNQVFLPRNPRACSHPTWPGRAEPGRMGRVLFCSLVALESGPGGDRAGGRADDRRGQGRGPGCTQAASLHFPRELISISASPWAPYSWEPRGSAYAPRSSWAPPMSTCQKMLVSTSTAIWTLRCSANGMLAHGNFERPYSPLEPVAALAGWALTLFLVFLFSKYEYLQVPVS